MTRKATTYWTTAFAVSAMLAAASCAKTETSADTNTSWVHCNHDDECESGECSDGYCTEPASSPATGGASGTGGATNGGSGNGGASATDPAWSCLDEPPGSGTNEGALTLELHTNDLQTGTAIAGAEVKLCRRIDVDCADPVGATQTTDEGGTVTLEVPAGFTGYAYLTSPAFKPALYFVPTVHRAVYSAQVPLMTPATESLIYSTLSVTRDPDLGMVLITARDCRLSTAKDISFSLQNTAGPDFVFYASRALPSLSASATDSVGTGGILNLAPGVFTLTSTVRGNDVSVKTALGRPGHVTYLDVSPLDGL